MTKEWTCTKQGPNSNMGTMHYDGDTIFHFGYPPIIKVGDKVKIEQGVGYLLRRMWVNGELEIDNSGAVIKSTE